MSGVVQLEEVPFPLQSIVAPQIITTDGDYGIPNVLISFILLEICISSVHREKIKFHGSEPTRATETVIEILTPFIIISWVMMLPLRWTITLSVNIILIFISLAYKPKAMPWDHYFENAEQAEKAERTEKAEKVEKAEQA